ATSPTTIAVTMPLPIFVQPISVTLADLSIASLASTSAVRPLVSIRPRASMCALAIANVLKNELVRLLIARSGTDRTYGTCTSHASHSSLKQLHARRVRQVAGVALVRVQVTLQLARRR